VTGRAWSELAAETTFKVEADGFTFILVEPSVLKLTALGVLPPSLVLGTGRGGAAAGAGSSANTVEKLLLDENAQDALLTSSLVSPKIGTDVEIQTLGKYRDTLILAILNRLSGVEAVASVQFPGEAPAGESDRSDGEGVGDAPVAGALASGE